MTNVKLRSLTHKFIENLPDGTYKRLENTFTFEDMQQAARFGFLKCYECIKENIPFDIEDFETDNRELSDAEIIETLDCPADSALIDNHDANYTVWGYLKDVIANHSAFTGFHVYSKDFKLCCFGIIPYDTTNLKFECLERLNWNTDVRLAFAYDGKIHKGLQIVIYLNKEFSELSQK